MLSPPGSEVEHPGCWCQCSFRGFFVVSSLKDINVGYYRDDIAKASRNFRSVFLNCCVPGIARVILNHLLYSAGSLNRLLVSCTMGM